MNLHRPEPSCGEDVAAYALGALGRDEAERFAEHLRGCELCRSDLAALRPVVQALPETADQVDPPPELKRRIMAAVEADVAARAPAPARREDRLAFLRVRPAPALAAACVLLVAGLGIGIGITGDGGGDPRTVTGQVAAVNATAVLEMDDDHGRLLLDGMPDPPRDRVWQVWIVRGEGADPQPTDALFTVGRNGRASVDVPGDMSGVTQVLVSHEPLGGSEAPTSDPAVQIAV
jgi:anti-sigma-K factor RskA